MRQGKARAAESERRAPTARPPAAPAASTFRSPLAKKIQPPARNPHTNGITYSACFVAFPRKMLVDSFLLSLPAH